MGEKLRTYCYKEISMKYFLGEGKMTTKEDKRMIKLDFYVFQNCPI